MNHDYFHIKKVHINVHQKNEEENAYNLIIETELPLPQLGHSDPKLDTLLAEIADLKERNPKLFTEVDNVEIRHMSGASENAHADRSVSEAMTGGIANNVFWQALAAEKAYDRRNNH